MIVEKTTGKAIAESVRRKLESLNLDIKKTKRSGFWWWIKYEWNLSRCSGNN